MLRVDYHDALDKARRDLITLGALTRDALRHALRAFKSADTTMAGRIIADDKLDLVRRKVESACVELLWRQQPLASELREVTAIHEIATDLGIISGHVNEIAKQAIKVASADACLDTSDVQAVAAISESMLADAMLAFDRRDETLAQSVYARVGQIEDYYTPAIEQIQAQMQANPNAISCGVALLFEMTTLQRIAERAENIAWHAEEML